MRKDSSSKFSFSLDDVYRKRVETFSGPFGKHQSSKGRNLCYRCQNRRTYVRNFRWNCFKGNFCYFRCQTTNVITKLEIGNWNVSIKSSFRKKPGKKYSWFWNERRNMRKGHQIAKNSQKLLLSLIPGINPMDINVF